MKTVIGKELLEVAKKVKARHEKNIKFFKERIAIQDSHENWYDVGRWVKSGGHWAEKTYYPYDIEQSDEIIKKCDEIINKTENDG